MTYRNSSTTLFATREGISRFRCDDVLQSRRNVDIVAASRDQRHYWHQTLHSNGFETRSDPH